MLPYFFRHYDQFVDQYYIFDNHSTDGSADLIQSHSRSVLRTFDTGGEYREGVLTRLRNQAWKNSRTKADLVIVCDIDEHLYHPRIHEFLEQFHKGELTVARPHGYDMISDQLPTTDQPIYTEVRKGSRAFKWDKVVLFKPTMIRDINYFPGSHYALPEGRIRYHKEDPELKLLHFRFLGFDYIWQKHQDRQKRYSDTNRASNWGFHYLFSEEKLKQIFDETKANAQPVID